MLGTHQDHTYWDKQWDIEFTFPLPINLRQMTQEEYIAGLVAAGLCSEQAHPTWNSVMGEVQMWGRLARIILHNYSRTEEQALQIVSDRSKIAWNELMTGQLKHLAHKNAASSLLPASAPPLRPENQRELIEQLENVRSQFFYTTPEQIDKEVGRLNSARLGLLHSIYNVAGVVMAPAEVSTLVSASHILSTKISGLMQTRKRLAEQAKDKQSDPLDTSL